METAKAIQSDYFELYVNKLINYYLVDSSLKDTSFSPNNTQRLIFSKEGVMAMYYTGRRPSGFNWDFDRAIRECSNLKSPLSVLTGDRICKNIQEVYFLMDSSEMVSLRLFDFKSTVKLTTGDGNFRFPRLQGVFYIKNMSFKEFQRIAEVAYEEDKNIKYLSKPSLLDREDCLKPYFERGQLGVLDLPYNKDWREATGLTGGSVATYPNYEGNGRPLSMRMLQLTREVKKVDAQKSSELLASKSPKVTEGINEVSNALTLMSSNAVIGAMFKPLRDAITKELLHTDKFSASKEVLCPLIKSEADVERFKDFIAKSFLAYVKTSSAMFQETQIPTQLFQYQASAPFANTVKILERINSELKED